MKQVIFLGFYCQIYNKAPTARIYVGDVMIDEIEIPECCPEVYMRDGQLTCLSNNNLDGKVLERSRHTFSQHELNPKLYEKNHFLDPYWWQKESDINHYSFHDICRVLDPDNRTKEKIIHPKFFVFIIDDETLGASQGVLRIEIKNSDSNHINGFMTRSTLLYLSHFYIMPYALFRNPIEITQRYWDSFSRKASAHTMKSIFNNALSRIEWPFNLQNYFELFDSLRKDSTINNVFGGDGIIEISMKKKNKIWWPKKLGSRTGHLELNWLFIKDFVVGLSDKYKQDEDQRDSD